MPTYGYPSGRRSTDSKDYEQALTLPVAYGRPGNTRPDPLAEYRNHFEKGMRSPTYTLPPDFMQRAGLTPPPQAPADA